MSLCKEKKLNKTLWLESHNIWQANRHRNVRVIKQKLQNQNNRISQCSCDCYWSIEKITRSSLIISHNGQQVLFWKPQDSSRMAFFRSPTRIQSVHCFPNKISKCLWTRTSPKTQWIITKDLHLDLRTKLRVRWEFPEPFKKYWLTSL